MSVSTQTHLNSSPENPSFSDHADRARKSSSAKLTQWFVEERHWLIVIIPLLIAMWSPVSWLIDLWRYTFDAQGYQPFIPLGVAYLVWADRGVISSAYHELAGIYDDNSKMRRGTPLVAYAGCILLLLSYVVTLPTIAVFGFIVTVIGIILNLYGFNILRLLWRPALFSLMMVPIPNVAQDMATSWLQRGCAFVAGQILHLIYPATKVQGNFIYMGNYTAVVSGPCSGVGILLPVLVLTFFLALLRKMRWIQTLILLGCSAGIALLMNTVRIIIMGLIGVRNPGLAASFHDANSWIFTALAFALTFLLAGRIGPRVSRYDDDDYYYNDSDDEESDEE